MEKFVCFDELLFDIKRIWYIDEKVILSNDILLVSFENLFGDYGT